MAQIKNTRRRPHRRHRHRRLQPDRRGRWPATRSRSRWSSAACTRSTTTTSRRCARPSAKLQLNDSSFTYQPENSEGLGFGFRCGFLGHAPPRDHPAAARTRQRARPGADRPERDLRDPQRATARSIVIDNPQEVPDAGQIEEFREPIVQHQLPAAGREHRRPDAAVHRAPRHLRPHRVPEPDAGHPRLRDAARGSDLRPVRQAQVGDARLRHDGLRVPRLPRRPTWCGSTSWCTASASTPCRPSSTAPSPTAAAASWSRSCASEIDRHLFEIALQAAIGSRIIARENDRRRCRRT